MSETQDKKKYPSRKDLIAKEKEKSLGIESFTFSSDGQAHSLAKNTPNFAEKANDSSNTSTVCITNFSQLPNNFVKQNFNYDYKVNVESKEDDLVYKDLKAESDYCDTKPISESFDECDLVSDDCSLDENDIFGSNIVADNEEFSNTRGVDGVLVSDTDVCVDSADKDNIASIFLEDDFIDSKNDTAIRKRIRVRHKANGGSSDLFGSLQTDDTAGYLKKISPKKFIVSRSFLIFLQFIIVIAIPMTGVLNIPLSSILSADTYESILSKIGEEHIDLDSQLHSVATANSRFKVIEGSKERCVPAGSANGDKMADDDFPLQWPMFEASYRLTSPFGYRSDPATGRHVLHSGLDMAAPLGTPIVAIANGKVTKVDVYGGAGRVIISHIVNGVPVESWYLHMYQNGIFVKEGQQVKRGDNIAAVGSSGYSTGSHLHFEIHPYGEEAVDPNRWLKENKAVLVPREC